MVLSLAHAHTQCPLLDPLSITKYKDNVPQPAVAKPVSYHRTSEADPGIPYYEITARKARHYFHSELGPGYVFAYGGTYPGPLFDIQRDTPILVGWINDLPSRHFLPVDATVLAQREYASYDNFGVPIVSHLHGGQTSAKYDGIADHYVVPGKTFVAIYLNNQNASTAWYHDHSIGFTRLNVYAGMAGPYLIRDDVEAKLNLPKGEYEKVLMFSDKMLCADGTLYYPHGTEEEVGRSGRIHRRNFTHSNRRELPFPSIVPEFFGNVMIVNGIIWPKMIVKNRPYRFRMFCGTNARPIFFQLAIGSPASENLMEMTIIGRDGGFLRNPVKTTTLYLLSGQRADILVDFSVFEKGTSVYFINIGPDVPFKGLSANHPPAEPQTTRQLMKFAVQIFGSAPPSEYDVTQFPTIVPYPPTWCRAKASDSLTIKADLTEEDDEYGRILIKINHLDYRDPVTNSERLPVNTVVFWEFINYTEDVHPIHIHQSHFTVCGRAVNDAEGLQWEPPGPDERGMLDVVQSDPGAVVRVATVFPLPGKFAYHCHVLEHEEYAMMRPFFVVNDGIPTREALAMEDVERRLIHSNATHFF